MLSLNCAPVGALIEFWFVQARCSDDKDGKAGDAECNLTPITRGYQQHMFSLAKTEGKASHSQAASLSWYSKVRDWMVAVNEETWVESFAQGHIRGLVLIRILN